MYNIAQSLGLHTVFLRYNPDTFKVDGCTVRIPKEKRLEFLKNELEKHMTTYPTEPISGYKLFYNGEELQDWIFD